MTSWALAAGTALAGFITECPNRLEGVWAVQFCSCALWQTTSGCNPRYWGADVSPREGSHRPRHCQAAGNTAGVQLKHPATPPWRDIAHEKGIKSQISHFLNSSAFLDYTKEASSPSVTAFPSMSADTHRGVFQRPDTRLMEEGGFCLSPRCQVPQPWG